MTFHIMQHEKLSFPLASASYSQTSELVNMDYVFALEFPLEVDNCVKDARMLPERMFVMLNRN